MKNSWQRSRNIRRCVTESALFAVALFCLAHAAEMREI